MDARELVDHIHSGPTKLMLADKPLLFGRRTFSHSNTCDFNEFLQALQSSETIREVLCKSHLHLRITEDEWVLLLKALGRIKDIQHFEFFCQPGSSKFHHFQVVADAVNNAHSLCKLKVAVRSGSFTSNYPSGLIALTNSIREHRGLHEFTWSDVGRRRGPRSLSLDPVLRALPACTHLREIHIQTKCASVDAIKNLLQLQSTTSLHLILEKEFWLAVADEIRRGRCNVQWLTFGMPLSSSAEATEALHAIASAIQLDQNLEHLTLRMEDGFTNEACVALAEALMVNKTLRKITLSTALHPSRQALNRAPLGAPAYEAFSAMLRVNTSLVLKLPPYEPAGAGERLRESREQMRIEQRLNEVGRGRLMASRQATRAEYVDSLNELKSDNDHNSPAFQVGCLYSLLRLNPSIV
jgi:hypothetical protein